MDYVPSGDEHLLDATIGALELVDAFVDAVMLTYGQRAGMAVFLARRGRGAMGALEDLERRAPWAVQMLFGSIMATPDQRRARWARPAWKAIGQCGPGPWTAQQSAAAMEAVALAMSTGTAALQ